MHTFARDPGFPARLKNGKGEILAEGCATLGEEKGTVEFESDFVPLYPIGTPLIVERMYENKAIHCFYGEVYLSDKKLIRLTGVTDELLPGSELVYDIETEISATLKEQKVACAPPKRFFRRKLQDTAKTYSIKIKSISAKGVEFDSKEDLDPERSYLLAMGEPLELNDIPVSIDKVYAFHKDIGYLCRFETMPADTRASLDMAIREMNRVHNRIF